MNSTLSEELLWRGFTHQTTLAKNSDLDQAEWTFYWGVDPSADSMTVGNLAIAMLVRHFISAGHKAILLVGGATAAIGDPDGKASERKLLSKEDIAQNKQKITEQYRSLFNGLDFEVVDNDDWFKEINYIDFLREVGKNVPMSQMLGRDFVQSRLGSEGSGISYAEFSYSLIQGYDFLHLSKEKGVNLQICGSDQWGNSIAGVDLIRRVEGKEAHIWSAPLVVNQSTGIKFGKTEDGAVWLDTRKTSVFKFYQFWLNLDDESAKQFLKIYTMIPKNEIEQIINDFDQERSTRLAQKRLAYEVTKIVHGQDRADSVVKVSGVLFGGENFNNLTESDINLLSEEIVTVNADESLLKTLADAGLTSSNGEANRLIAGGAISVNGVKLESSDFSFNSGYSLLKKGKNTFALIKNQ